MRITLYTVAALTLIVFVGAFAHYINPSSYATNLFGMHLDFPVAIWIVIPMMILLVASIGHMMFYGLKNHFKLRRWVKDTDTLKDALYWSILKEPQRHKYLKSQMKDGAKILDGCHIEVNCSAEGLDNRFVGAMEIVKDIKNGNYVEIKDKKIKNALSKTNPLMIQNEINRLKTSNEFVESVLRSRESYDKSIVQSALDIYFAKATFDDALKYISMLTMKHFYKMLDRVDEGEKIGLTQEMVSKYVKHLDFECENYMRLAQTTTKKFTPSANILLFDTLRKADEQAENAYIYVLFEYEKIEDAQEFLDEQQENEFVRYRAMLELKRNNFRFKLEDFIDIDRACR
ncbi:MAG: hypothetical protein JXQ76_00510 [Campylobacterales bacterium]|nr:hypothetical protein [Campylobacterales bacterium]